MQNGVCPFVDFDASGEIKLIATGADACAEHACGLAPLQSMLCEAQCRVLLDGVDCELDCLSGRSDLLAGYFQGEVSLEFPALLSRKRISKNLGRVGFEVGSDEGEPTATVWFSCDSNACPYQAPLPGFQKGLQFLSIFALGQKARHYPAVLFDSHKRLRVAGAWDSQVFALSVRGSFLVDRLARFYARLQAGRFAFGASFVREHKGYPLSGVVLVDLDRLDPGALAAIDSAQQRYVSDCLLTLGDAAARVNAHKAKGPLRLSYLWNVWHPGDKLGCNGDWIASFADAKRVPRVACAVNPISNTAVDYYGPYEPEDLIAYATGSRSTVKSIYAKAHSDQRMA